MAYGLCVQQVRDFTVTVNIDISEDIINTLYACGTLIGVIVFKLIFHKGKLMKVKGRAGKMNMAIFILVAFLCRFLAFNEFGMAKLIYEF